MNEKLIINCFEFFIKFIKIKVYKDVYVIKENIF